MKARCIASASALLVVLLAAGEPCCAEETKPTTGVSYFTIGTPVVKLQMAQKGVYLEPTFVPGPGIGYIWDGGKWGVVFFPGLGALDRGDLSIAPHVSFQAYVVSLGLGYEFRFARTNDNQSTRLQAGFPIVTLGLSFPLVAWLEKK